MNDLNGPIDWEIITEPTDSSKCNATSQLQGMFNRIISQCLFRAAAAINFILEIRQGYAGCLKTKKLLAQPQAAESLRLRGNEINTRNFMQTNKTVTCKLFIFHPWISILGIGKKTNRYLIKRRKNLRGVVCKNGTVHELIKKINSN